MGCDIHLFCQVRDNSGRWQFVDFPDILVNRNYTWFGILAGVRNGWFEPIAYPRGLPDDFVLSRDKDNGDHSFSWLTYDEILAYDWSQKYESWEDEQTSLANTYSDYLTALKETFTGYDPHDCRLVFGFDS